ncbi:MAG: 16S rRNA (cytosine(1402)-N(4))-methyltransferase RsmH [Bacteroidales bacterium]|nr:16S rRNA (cytosine(1402)-N(4))-methyltransferase RsmH [Bacteroidales bacterium]
MPNLDVMGIKKEETSGCYHVPVMLEESVKGLNIRPDGVYADATFGGGGHARAILEQLITGRLIALDRDAEALTNCPGDERIIAVQGNFRFLRHYLAHYGYRKIDGILADLGVSSHHFDTPERGFTFREDTPLDMRMNIEARTTARDIVNLYPEERLRRIFADYGELPDASRLAHVIVNARRHAPIERSGNLLGCIRDCVPRGAEHKYLAKVFQALRIEVNREMENLKTLLLQSVELLHNGGRIAVITYHSLEDRMVKRFFRHGTFDGKVVKDIYGNSQMPFRQVNTKVVTPSDAEIAANNRARSAKLRIGEKIENYN